MGTLISKSSLLHLRIPFSLFLLPIFLFSLSLSPNINPERILIVFMCLHLFLYPATNGFNSYYDKDEESIGGLKNPPKTTRDLLFLSLFLDLVAILLALKISLLFAVFIFTYGIVSKAYSHPAIRLKKYPWVSWLVAGIFQGGFTFAASYIGLNDFTLIPLKSSHLLIPAFLTTVLLWANYPLTQIYQHNEDARRGDMTLSRYLGTKGTFIFSAVFFIVAAAGFFLYFDYYFKIKYAYGFILVLMLPVTYFIYWFFKFYRNSAAANYTNTMRLNWIASLALNAFFIYLFLDSTQVLQAIQGGY